MLIYVAFAFSARMFTSIPYELISVGVGSGRRLSLPLTPPNERTKNFRVQLTKRDERINAYVGTIYK